MSTYVTKRAAKLGLKKVEAKRPLILEVFPGDLAKAQKRNSKHCAFACAAERAVPGVKAAYFFRSTAWLEYEDRVVRYSLPQSMQKEIVAFDRFGSMDAGSYRLSVPSKTLAQVRAQKRYPVKVPTAKYVSHKVILHRTGGIRTALEPKS